ncbi:MAG: hypothetical protein ABFR95_05105 [Actinomycetota bacterium]
MTEFSVRLANRPGQLATLTRLLAVAAITVEAFAAVSANGEAHVRIVVEDARKTRRVLSDAAIDFTERDVLDTFVHRGSPGLAEMAETLARADVNIDSMYLLHTNAEGFHLALTVSDSDRAHEALAS